MIISVYFLNNTYTTILFQLPGTKCGTPNIVTEWKHFRIQSLSLSCFKDRKSHLLLIFYYKTSLLYSYSHSILLAKFCADKFHIYHNSFNYLAPYLTRRTVSNYLSLTNIKSLANQLGCVTSLSTRYPLEAMNVGKASWPSVTWTNSTDKV